MPDVGFRDFVTVRSPGRPAPRPGGEDGGGPVDGEWASGGGGGGGGSRGALLGAYGGTMGAVAAESLRKMGRVTGGRVSFLIRGLTPPNDKDAGATKHNLREVQRVPYYACIHPGWTTAIEGM